MGNEPGEGGRIQERENETMEGKGGTRGIRLIVNSRLNRTNLSVKLVPGPLSAPAQGRLFPLCSQQPTLPFPVLKISCELK